MRDEEIEELLGSLKGDDRSLPAATAERIWTAVEARAFGPPQPVRRVSRLVWPVGLAATLLVGLGIGFGLGRGVGADPPTEELGLVQSAPPVADQYLHDAAVLLAPLGGEEPLLLTPAMQQRARELLFATRLALDASVSDPTLRALLDDLELVLAQMVPLSGFTDLADARWVNQALTERALLPRLSEVIAIARGGD